MTLSSQDGAWTLGPVEVVIQNYVDADGNPLPHENSENVEEKKEEKSETKKDEEC